MLILETAEMFMHLKKKKQTLKCDIAVTFVAVYDTLEWNNTCLEDQKRNKYIEMNVRF